MLTGCLILLVPLLALFAFVDHDRGSSRSGNLDLYG